MECIPAIDLRAGRSVRLLRGAFRDETVYGDPVEQALAYDAAGAQRLHVVDLDAARSGRGENDLTVGRIAAAVRLPIEVGGGVRSAERAGRLLEMGVDRVVVGTVAIEAPDVLGELCAEFPGRVVVGLDHRRVRRDGSAVREVALRGWEVGSGVDLEDALRGLEHTPVAAVIVTDIARDGTLEGPDLDGLRLALATSPHPVIASGGVGGVGDLEALAGLEEAGRRLAGVIIGKALLSGTLSLEEARRACAA